ncbi:hypothetical protein PanWU01x14_148740 [Parasponia andersonii]|uniref:Uncharacterized protein n=1 Tax=Parasponia andersonii TaxID=3476 RepID=A0A2P5CJ74_PARAD|nr:hypothetical protein PanWU01x14_148740 [Parasponia andersonii]
MAKMEGYNSNLRNRFGPWQWGRYGFWVGPFGGDCLMREGSGASRASEARETCVLAEVGSHMGLPAHLNLMGYDWDYSISVSNKLAFKVDG